MTTITPPPPPIPPPSTMTAWPVAVVANPPKALADLGVGALLKGMVVQQDAKGAIQLETPVGALTIRTAFAAPLGALLALQIQSLYPQAQLQILTIDGEALRRGAAAPSLAKGLVPPAAGAPPGGAAVMGATGTFFVNLTVGGQAIATVIRPPQGLPSASVLALGPASGPFPTTSASTTPASGIAPAPAWISPQSAGQAAQGGNEAPSAALQGRHVQGSPAAATPAPAGSAAASFTSAPIGTQMAVKVISIQPPSQPLPQGGPSLTSSPAGLDALVAGRTLDAVVTGFTTAGSPIVMTAIGELSLAARAALSEGAILILQLIGKPLFPQASLGAFANEPGASMFLSRNWPALGEAAQVLQEADAAVIQNLINNVLPRPDSHLAANILFFMTALRGGNLADWLGDSADKILARAKPSLAARLREDFNALARMSNEPMPASDWRITLIPFFNGSEFEQIRMMTRRHGGEEGDEEDQKNIRFIIEMNLTQLGRFQIDGLLRNQGKHMELLVRTESHLPDKMQNGIRNIFLEASELTGVKGGVGFQAAPPNFIEAAVEEITGGGGKDGLIV